MFIVFGISIDLLHTPVMDNKMTLLSTATGATRGVGIGESKQERGFLCREAFVLVIKHGNGKSTVYIDDIPTNLHLQGIFQFFSLPDSVVIHKFLYSHCLRGSTQMLRSKANTADTSSVGWGLQVE